jgi:large subunit ribosomal protein L29
MNAAEMRTKTESELNSELVELRREQFNMRMQRAVGQLGNPSRFNEIRKEIARIKTVLNEKARAAS